MEDHARRAAVEAIDQQARRLDELVADLLTVSSMRTGDLAVTPRPLVLSDWLDQAITIAEVPATVCCAPEVRVRADPPRLLQILVNLLSNARKYGAPPVVVRGSTHEGRTVIEVSDRGPGVPDAFVPRMFEEFTQASIGETRTADGHGLGLTIVRYLVGALQGTVTYRSPEGGGAIFTVDLPAGTGDEKSASCDPLLTGDPIKSHAVESARQHHADP
jgi:signal transduction histidine kinase